MRKESYIEKLSNEIQQHLEGSATFWSELKKKKNSLTDWKKKRRLSSCFHNSRQIKCVAKDFLTSRIEQKWVVACVYFTRFCVYQDCKSLFSSPFMKKVAWMRKLDYAMIIAVLVHALMWRTSYAFFASPFQEICATHFSFLYAFFLSSLPLSCKIAAKLQHKEK